MTVEVHDHGATAGGVLGELMRGSLDHCVKCTICETLARSRSDAALPRPKYVGPAGRALPGGRRSPDASLDYCSGCGICTQVCPQGVQIAEINAQARADSQGTGCRSATGCIARPTVPGRLGAPVAPLANWALAQPPLRALGERRSGSTATRRCRASPGARSSAGPAGPPAGRGAPVVFFHGCGDNYYEPAWGDARRAARAQRLRGRRAPSGLLRPPAAVERVFDDARGVRAEARRRARAVRAEGDDIVATSTSCGLMLKREASEILEHGGRRSADRVRRMYDICEYLLAARRAASSGPTSGRVPLTVPYHAPCQQRGHGIGKPALDLFALFPSWGIELDATCCGIAGTYGLKKEKYADRDGGRLASSSRDRRGASRT